MVQTLKRFGIIYAALLLVFLATLYLSAHIPSSSLRPNIGKSAAVLQKEGLYPSTGIPHRMIVLDNYTDALMLNTAYSIESADPIRSALINSRGVEVRGQTDQVKNLESTYQGSAKDTVQYERYWHGYLVFLRPLLTVFSYPEIRIVLSILLYAAFAAFIFLSWQKLGSAVTGAFILGFVAVDFFSIGSSMQFSAVFLIGLLSTVFILKTYKKGESLNLVFFTIGGLTAFFDLMTAPLVAVGIPLVAASILQKKKHILSNYASWWIGAVSLWATKILIAGLILSPTLGQSTWNTIVERTIGRADANFSHLNALKLNIFQLVGYDKVSKIVFVAIAGLILIFFLRYQVVTPKRLRAAVPWMVLALLPYLWYLMGANHSYVHVWYTYRNQFLTVVSVLIGLIELIDWGRVKIDFTKAKSLR